MPSATTHPEPAKAPPKSLTRLVLVQLVWGLATAVLAGTVWFGTLWLGGARLGAQPFSSIPKWSCGDLLLVAAGVGAGCGLVAGLVCGLVLGKPDRLASSIAWGVCAAAVGALGGALSPLAIVTLPW